MNTVLEKPVNSSELTQAQLEAIKSRAITLWGEDKWLSKLVTEYERITNAGHRTRYTMIKRWFDPDGNSPTLESFNNLLLAIGCKMAIECPEVITKAQRIL